MEENVLEFVWVRCQSIFHACALESRLSAGSIVASLLSSVPPPSKPVKEDEERRRVPAPACPCTVHPSLGQQCFNVAVTQ